MAASHAVDCLLLAFASSPAVSFSCVRPSAPGAANHRDMPVARALPPAGGRPGKKGRGDPTRPGSHLPSWRRPGSLLPTPHAGAGGPGAPGDIRKTTPNSQDGKGTESSGPQDKLRHITEPREPPLCPPGPRGDSCGQETQAGPAAREDWSHWPSLWPHSCPAVESSRTG